MKIITKVPPKVYTSSGTLYTDFGLRITDYGVFSFYGSKHTSQLHKGNDGYLKKDTLCDQMQPEIFFVPIEDKSQSQME